MMTSIHNSISILHFIFFCEKSPFSVY